jgi:hypothetical protein
MKLENGYLVEAADRLLRLLSYLNVIELIKILGDRVAVSIDPSLSGIDRRRVANFLIDTFILAKWTLVVTLLATGTDSFIWSAVVIYLGVFNTVGYFRYHAWGGDYAAPWSRERERRRFISFLQALLFSVVCFAFLYANTFSDLFMWPAPGATVLSALELSISKTFTLSNEGFSPLCQFARYLLLAQVGNTFVFVVILLANSVPSVQSRADERDDGGVDDRQARL